MGKNIRSFKSQINQISKNATVDSKKLYDFEEALFIIKTNIAEYMKDENKTIDESKKSTENVIKDKVFYKERKEKNRTMVSEVYYQNPFKVKKYEHDALHSEESVYSDEEFITKVVNELVGYSVLEEAMVDGNGISDIFVMSWDKIYVEKNGKNEPYTYTFFSQKHYKDFINRIVGEAGLELNDGNKKIVDFELFGDRYNCIASSIAVHGRAMTIRKHSSSHITLEQILKYNVMTPEVSKILGLALLGESNIIVGGITGSGKTTTLRALLDHYVTVANKRMLVVEDTRELMPENDHTLELVTVNVPGKADLSVTLDDLIVAALRLKPKYIAIGEVRGKEAVSAIEAAETGHSTIFTMHGGTSWNIINRLITKYLSGMAGMDISGVERIIGVSVDFIAIQADIPGIGRRIVSVDEINYDFKNSTVMIKPIVKFNHKTKEFMIVGKISFEKAEKMMTRGVPYEDLTEIVDFSTSELYS